MSFHYYVDNTSVQYQQGQSQLEMWKLYDADDRATLKSIDALNEALNTKMSRIRWTRHHQLKVKPCWSRLVNRPKSPTIPTMVATWSGGKDNPW